MVNMVDINTFIREYRGVKFSVLRMNEFWHETKTLFEDTSVTDRERMQEVGKHFWGAVREAFQEVLLLYINKLIDIHEVGGRQNLTLGRLLWSARQNMERDDYRRLIRIYGDIKELAGAVRGWRNKWYQHLDYDFVLGNPGAVILPPIPGIDLVKIIGLINKFMTAVSKATGDNLDYGSLTFNGDGGEVLAKLTDES